MSTPAPTPPASGFSWLLQELREHPLMWLLLAFPVAVALEFAHDYPVALFVASGIAIIPLAGLMGRATESLAEVLGPGIGGLLNATFGNAAELIIAVMVLWEARDPEKTGQMHALVKASMTGSIIGNVLLVLGLAILCGGFFHKRQKFNATAASMGTTMLTVAAIGLLVPSLFSYVATFTVVLAQQKPHGPIVIPPDEARTIVQLSEEIALILAGIYVLSLLFSLRTHKHLFAGNDEAESGEKEEPEWSWGTAMIILAVATAGVAVMAEFLVGSFSAATSTLGMSEVFVGVIVVAVIGNAAEHSTAVLVAMKNKMDLAITIALSSSLQIALFVAPVLVFASMLIGGQPTLDLHFTLMEILAIILSILVAGQVAADGDCHWMEGVMLLGLYLIFALAFWYLPGGGLIPS